MIIPEVTSKPIDRIAISQEQEFKIKSSSKAFKLLSSTLYPDPIAAPIRELGTNASDSHKEADNPDPFLVHLPNELEPFFYIRDYGTGMSEEMVYEVYCTYFASTRSESNDYTGAFGLGSKTPFCYSDTFNVISFYNGKKYIFTAFLENGVPKIAKFGEDNTDERNGVQVSFPVKNEDISRFVSTAKTIYSRFVNKPSIIGAANFSLDVPVYSVSHPTWRIRKGNSNIYVVMGNIGYQLNLNTLFSNDHSNPLRSMCKIGLEINFDIGELQPTVSREEIQYDQETCKKILNRISVIRDELLKEAKEKMSAADTHIESILIYRDYTVGDGANLHEVFKSYDFRGKTGKKVDGYCYSHYNLQTLYTSVSKREYITGVFHGLEEVTFTPSGKIRIKPIKDISFSRNDKYIIDNERNRDFNKKVRFHLQSKNYRRVFIIRSIHDEFINFLVNYFEMDVSKFENISTFPLPPKLPKAPRNRKPVEILPKELKHLKYYILDEYDYLRSTYETVNVTESIETPVLYIRSSYGELSILESDRHSTSPFSVLVSENDLQNHLRAYKKIKNTTKSPKIYILTKSQFPSASKRWKNFFNEFDKELDSYLVQNSFLNYNKLKNDLSNVHENYISLFNIILNNKIELKEGTHFKKFADVYFKRYKEFAELKEKLKDFNEKFRSTKNSVTDYDTIEKEYKKFLKRFDYLRLVNFSEKAQTEIKVGMSHELYKEYIAKFIEHLK